MTPPLRALVSIHDVMPETLDLVQRQLDYLDSRAIRPVTLLVVPGKPWQPSDLDTLRRWVDEGRELAGHGWSHRIHVRRRSAYHRLHAAVLSRDAGEHLSLPPRKAAQIMARNFRWFQEQGLPEPVLYVPPAWAMGSVSRRTLDRLPFRYYEFLGGVYDARARRLRLLPVMGYEADNASRAAGVTVSNAANTALSRLTGRPVRLGLHPYDFELNLSQAARDIFAQELHCLSYMDLGL